MTCRLSNDLICNCKELVRECIDNSSLNINCDDVVACIHEEIDVEKFKTWFQFNLDKFKSKTNQNTYFKKSFLNELEKGTFEYIRLHYIPNTQPFINDLRNKGICVLANDCAYLFVIWDNLINYCKVPVDVARELNRKILNYLTPNNNFEDYKALLRKSKTLSTYNIDWNKVEDETNKFIADWNKTLDELGDLD